MNKSALDLSRYCEISISNSEGLLTHLVEVTDTILGSNCRAVVAPGVKEDSAHDRAVELGLPVLRDERTARRSVEEAFKSVVVKCSFQSSLVALVATSTVRSVYKQSQSSTYVLPFYMPMSSWRA